LAASSVPDKLVVLTFDDSVASHHTVAAPLLKQYEPEFPYAAGRGHPFQPGFDHPLLIPTAGDARPDWTLEDFKRAVAQAHDGRVAVLQFHGVPEGEHPWVHTPRERFQEYMAYLHQEKFRVIALRDLAPYLSGRPAPPDPMTAIRQRVGQSSAAGRR
jgi:peptidoglycan/xylan/chitin deacetylase (PgdA/CDA1 family)